MADPANGYAPIGGMPNEGSAWRERPAASIGEWMLAPIVRASTSAWYCVTWWSPKATCSITVCDGVFGKGSVVMCCATPSDSPRSQRIWIRSRASGRSSCFG